MDEWTLRDILLHGTMLVKSLLVADIDIETFQKWYGSFYHYHMLDGYESELNGEEAAERKRYREAIDIHKLVCELESKFFDESFPNAEQYVMAGRIRRKDAAAYLQKQIGIEKIDSILEKLRANQY